MQRTENMAVQDIAKIMRETGEYVYNEEVCFDKPYGFQYSEDDKHFYLYRSKRPKWLLELQDETNQKELSATLRKAAEYLSKGYGQTKE